MFQRRSITCPENLGGGGVDQIARKSDAMVADIQKADSPSARFQRMSFAGAMSTQNDADTDVIELLVVDVLRAG
jgi:hypothetical protein